MRGHACRWVRCQICPARPCAQPALPHHPRCPPEAPFIAPPCFVSASPWWEAAPSHATQSSRGCCNGALSSPTSRSALPSSSRLAPNPATTFILRQFDALVQQQWAAAFQSPFIPRATGWARLSLTSRQEQASLVDVRSWPTPRPIEQIDWLPQRQGRKRRHSGEGAQQGWACSRTEVGRSFGSKERHPTHHHGMYAIRAAAQRPK